MRISSDFQVSTSCINSISIKMPDSQKSLMMGLIKGRGKRSDTTPAASRPSSQLPALASEVLEKQISVPHKMEFPQLSPRNAQPPKQEQQIVVEQPSYDEIRQFENAVRGMDSVSNNSNPVSHVSHGHERFAYGFFHEMEKKIKEQGHSLDISTIVGKMKQFHAAKSDGSPFYYSATDVQSVVDQKMAELKSMENRWIETKQALELSQQELIVQEAEMKKKLDEVQELLRHSKVMEQLEKTAPENQAFVLSTGAKVKSLLELAVALKSMSDDTFSSHVSADRHDFAVWVNDVFGMQPLAQRLSSARDRLSAAKVLTDYTG